MTLRLMHTNRPPSRAALLSLILPLVFFPLTGCGISAARSTTVSNQPAPAPLFGAAPVPTLIDVEVYDISVSTAYAKVQAQYRQDFAAVVGSFVGGEVLEAYALTGNTQATSGERVKVAFPTFNPFLDNRDQAKTKLEAARQSALRQTSEMLKRMPRATASDLLHSCCDAAKVFNSVAYRGVKNKQLILHSDMIQQANRDDFLAEALTPERIAAIIKHLQDTGQMPDLRGVTVYVAGACADPQGRITPDKIAEIRAFWITYFKAAGANLTPEHYGSVLSADATASH